MCGMRCLCRQLRWEKEEIVSGGGSLALLGVRNFLTSIELIN